MQDLSNLSYYELLGVGPESTHGEIVSAHRARVLRMHPDRFSDLEGPITNHFDGLTALFNDARDTLLDPAKRARYDADLSRRSRTSRTEGGGASAARGHEDRTRGSGFRPPGGGSAPPDDESGLEGERAARERRERMLRGEGGLAARLAYAIPPFAQTAALAVGASWLYSVAFFLLWQAGLALAGFLVYIALPLVCWRARSRWGRMTARVSWPHVRRWPGFAPYNRRWLGRGLLEAGALGAPLGLAGALVPYASPLLNLAWLATLALGALWVFALVGARQGRERAPGGPGPG